MCCNYVVGFRKYKFLIMLKQDWITRRIQSVFLLLLVSYSLIYSQGTELNPPGSICDCQNITVIQADTLIKANLQNDNFVIIDLRTPAEVATGFIENAINIDFRSPDFNTVINNLDKDKTYLIYCASGYRSGQAFDYMGNNGFTKVYNMLSGITGWKNSGFTVVFSTYSALTIIDDNNFKIYPNPCNNYFNIKSNFDKEFEVELLNSSGVSIFKKNYYNNLKDPRININRLLPGIYFVKVNLPRKSMVKSLVKY